jgi:hypothetical protein
MRLAARSAATAARSAAHSPSSPGSVTPRVEPLAVQPPEDEPLLPDEDDPLLPDDDDPLLPEDDEPLLPGDCWGCGVGDGETCGGLGVGLVVSGGEAGAVLCGWAGAVFDAFGFGGAGFGLRAGKAVPPATAVMRTCCGPWTAEAGWSDGVPAWLLLFFIAAPIPNDAAKARTATATSANSRRAVGRPSVASTGAKLLPAAVAPSTTTVLSS